MHHWMETLNRLLDNDVKVGWGLDDIFQQHPFNEAPEASM